LISKISKKGAIYALFAYAESIHSTVMILNIFKHFAKSPFNVNRVDFNQSNISRAVNDKKEPLCGSFSVISSYLKNSSVL